VDDSFYGLRIKPFSIVPDPECIFPARGHCAAMAVLEHAVRERAGFSLITGEVGTGKTTLVRRLVSHPPKGFLVGFVGSPHRSFGPLLGRALLAFGIQAPDGQPLQMIDQFQLFAEEMSRSGRRAILVVDEAQAMESERLEELRMLSTVGTDDWVPHIVLVGLPGVRETLRRADMLQLAQRLVGDCELRPLDQDETRRYIAYRLCHAGAGEEPIFGQDACDAVYRCTGGIPRLVNILCEDALIFGELARRRPIDAATILAMAEERARSGILPLTAAGSTADPGMTMPQLASA
jgi:type II secretory pathway predicted ATPase ExeA